MNAQYTPGPWRWEYSAQSKQVHLCGGRPRYDLRVMDFVRFGMNNAAPRFVERPAPGHEILERCDKFAVPVAGREHHASWFQDIAHPDARLIAAAPDLLEALTGLVSAIDRHADDGLQWRLSEAETAAHRAIAKATGQ